MASLFQSHHVQPTLTRSSFTSAPRQAQPVKPTPVDLSALQSASRTIQEQTAKDALVIPDLGETLTGGKQCPLPESTAC